MLSEATWLERPAGADHFHLTPTEAAGQASQAGVGRLILTHIWPTNDRRRMAEAAEAAFDGPVTVAHEGLRVTL